jgi:hypothetical protein
MSIAGAYNVYDPLKYCSVHCETAVCNQCQHHIFPTPTTIAYMDSYHCTTTILHDIPFLNMLYCVLLWWKVHRISQLTWDTGPVGCHAILLTLCAAVHIPGSQVRPGLKVFAAPKLRSARDEVDRSEAVTSDHPGCVQLFISPGI